MTVIAWDGRLVAADSLACYGTCRAAAPVQKLRQRGSTVYGLTGSGALFEPMIEWVEKGADPASAPTASEKHKDTRLIVWRDGACYCYTLDMPYPEELFAPDAWGIGADLAIGALEAGADAAKAVEITIKRETHTGGPVQVIDLHALKAKQELAA